jgi:hypothetical protein
MARPEIEGDWVMGWPDRKRPTLIAGFRDAQFGVVGDYRRIVPALAAAVAALKRNEQPA